MTKEARRLAGGDRRPLRASGRGQAVIQLDPDRFDEIAGRVGDTPFTVSPYFFLRRRACDVYADDAQHPSYGAIVPHTPAPDVYVFGAQALDAAAQAKLADCLAGIEPACGYLVPRDLVQPLRARRAIEHEVEGLCFTHRRPPPGFRIWRPELVRRLGPADLPLMADLPAEAAFVYHNYGDPAALLADGLAFGVVRDGRLVSLAASLARTPRYCDVGAYTRRRHRHRRYATDCVEALLAHLFDRGVQPLWRIGLRQKVALYFAEKMGMEEIGTDDQEVYLQAAPGC